jgi:hypothetical protein
MVCGRGDDKCGKSCKKMTVNERDDDDYAQQATDALQPQQTERDSVALLRFLLR